MDLFGKQKKRKLLLCTAALLVVFASYAIYSQLYPPVRTIGNVKSLVNISDFDTPLPEGAIPEIINPKFVSANVTYPEDKDLVVGIVYNGLIKAYPIKILNWHEVINDNFSGKPVAVTYCVLCRTPIAYESKVSGKIATFKVTGILYNSNDVLVDSVTRSYWSQLTGEAIMGDIVGKNLTRIPVETTTWSLWKSKYPDTLVMSSDTGFDRDYGTDPYGGYEESEKVWYRVKNEDKRLFVKDIIYGVTFAGEAKAYLKSNVTSIGVVNDQVGKQKLVVIYDKELDVIKIFDRNLKGRELNFEIAGDKIVDKETNSVWNYDGVAIEGSMKGEQLKRIDATYGFWYVWAAFYPKTGLYLVY
ncbi:MAG: DUF3179 domain-containing protein [Candidatus Aenigmarchaeota archaeon]|nr:DUF3179 domain-containing protein [Candidatus Aenigmarchaeota archaeon]